MSSKIMREVAFKIWSTSFTRRHRSLHKAPWAYYWLPVTWHSNSSENVPLEISNVEKWPKEIRVPFSFSDLLFGLGFMDYNHVIFLQFPDWQPGHCLQFPSCQPGYFPSVSKLVARSFPSTNICRPKSSTWHKTSRLLVTKDCLGGRSLKPCQAKVSKVTSHSCLSVATLR